MKIFFFRLLSSDNFTFLCKYPYIAMRMQQLDNSSIFASSRL